MKITEEEVQQILDLVDKSQFGELSLQSGELYLTVRKGGFTSTVEERHTPVRIVEAKNDGQGSPLQPEPKLARSGGGDTTAATEASLSIKAPMIGTFYSRPEPGAPAFVQPGSLVEEDSTVCLIETMKVFTSVKAGLRGYIEEVCVKDTQMVEYGQILFTVRPE